jgi:hypothetical protein
MLLAAGVLLGFSPAGCNGQDKREAAAVMHALDQLRTAPNADKGPFIEKLGLVGCSDPMVCVARDRCTGAYRFLVQGVEMERQVRKEIARLETAPPGDTHRVEELNAALDRASAELDRAEKAIPSCEEAVGDLRRKYAL